MKMCRVWEVSRSGYYDWMKKPESKRFQEDQQIASWLKQSHIACQGIYGLDKLLSDVREKFPTCSRKRVYRLQRKYGLYSIRKKPFKIQTTDSKHILPIAENILNREFKVSAPNTVWVTDITYLHIGDQVMYLAIVKDLFDKEIVGWKLDNHMRADLCIEALQNAIKKRKPPKGLIHHSDRGTQYCSYSYQDKLKKHHMICSMSRKGNCWDNACAETFFSALKSERIRHKKYEDGEDLSQDIFWYIEYFYNRHRRHQSLGNLTIPQFKRNPINQIAM